MDSDSDTSGERIVHLTIDPPTPRWWQFWRRKKSPTINGTEPATAGMNEDDVASEGDTDVQVVSDREYTEKTIKPHEGALNLRFTPQDQEETEHKEAKEMPEAPQQKETPRQDQEHEEKNFYQGPPHVFAPQKKAASTQQERAIHVLSLMLDIEQAVRRASTLDELRFIIVNRTYELVRYTRCALLEETPFGLRVSAVSNTPILNREAPFVLWLQETMRSYEKKRFFTKPRALQASDEEDLRQERWLELAPPHALVLPLAMHHGDRPGLLVLFSNQPWAEGDQVLLQHLCESYAHAIAPHLKRHFVPMLRRRRRILVWGIILLLLASGALPIRQKTLAPAEITPFDATLLSSPLDGVVKEILVEPNSEVTKEQIVMTLEDTEYRNAHVIAERSYHIAETKLHGATQEAFSNPNNKSTVALAQAELEKARVELQLAKERLNLLNVRSLANGIIIFRAKSDYEGQPISVGQRLFLIADPSSVELSIELPVTSATPIPDQAEVRFFQNSDPLNPIQGELVYHAIRAEANESGQAVYRLRANLEEGERIPRLGAKGTAHIYAGTTYLAYYIFRKPISLVRQYAGF